MKNLTPEQNNQYQKQKYLEFCVDDLDKVIKSLLPVANEEILEKLSRVRNHLKLKLKNQKQSQEYYPSIDDEEDDFVDLI